MNVMHQYKFGLLTTTLLLLSACGSISKTTTADIPVTEAQPTVIDPQPQPQPAEVDIPVEIERVEEPVKTPEPPSPVVVAEPVKRSPAVVSLLASADKQHESGDYHSAQNTLQRAQRIAPRDPEVYYNLAETHMQLETYALAEQVALKGVSLVQGQNKQLKRFWNLIADIRLRAGNPTGAEQAHRNAEKY